MIPKLTFREWSILVDEGPAGFGVLEAYRQMRRAHVAVFNQLFVDSLAHGTGIVRVSMGEGCTPLVRRVPPEKLRLPPALTDDLPAS